MRRRSIIAVVVAIVSGCGSTSSSSEPGSSPATGATAASTEPDRALDVTVGGALLSGHCDGVGGENQPTVVLSPGMGANQHALSALESELADRYTVCSYDRVGPSAGAQRTVEALAEELRGFLGAAGVAPPFILVGQSVGGNIVFRFAQMHPGEVRGFVSMNPVPPYKTWIAAASRVETKQELRDFETSFYAGENDEGLDLRSTELMLTEPLEGSMPYVVMFDEDCGGDTEFCGRVLGPLAKTTERLARVGSAGSFAWVKGAGHDIWQTDTAAVVAAIDSVAGPTP